MLTKTQLREKVEKTLAQKPGNSEEAGKRALSESAPIYEIMMMEKLGDTSEMLRDGRPSGFPDTGCTASMGFYHSLDDAYDAIVANACDIRETVYDAAFLFCRFPGLYCPVDSGWRMYFVFDNDTKEYKQQEEPKLFAHLAL